MRARAVIERAGYVAAMVMADPLTALWHAHADQALAPL
jgi:hypothetical protein